jgi:hypothetical protein
MDDLEELEKEEWIFEENIMEIRALKRSEVRLYDEHLIEIAKTTDGKGYHVNIYKVVASGALYNDPQMALMDAIRFLNRRDK